MRYLAVLLLAGLAIAAYAQTTQRPSADQRFVMIVADEGRVAWRLDTATGAISRCMAGDKSGSCQPWMR